MAKSSAQMMENRVGERTVSVTFCRVVPSKAVYHGMSSLTQRFRLLLHPKPNRFISARQKKQYSRIRRDIVFPFITIISMERDISRKLLLINRRRRVIAVNGRYFSYIYFSVALTILFTRRS
jgi:hypothetical protein